MLIIQFLIGCSNLSELETGEIKTLQLLKVAINQENKAAVFIDARKLLTRNQLDQFGAPVLFVELQTGQNGTFTLYPGQGVVQNWLGADGATVSLENGVLVATRGMGDDIMGATSSIPSWNKIERSASYKKETSYLAGNNLITQKEFECKINKFATKQLIHVWDISFKVTQYDEKCTSIHGEINNTYYVDQFGIVRRSIQYHSDTIGEVLIERIDR